jgi:restriction system protein
MGVYVVASKYLYSVHVSNNYLGVSKEIKAQTSLELDLKVAEQKRKWHEQAERKKEQERVQDLKQQADKMNIDAQNEMRKYERILIDSLSINYTIDWNSMLQNDSFPSFKFEVPEPKLEDAFLHYKVPKQRKLLEKIFKAQKEKRVARELEAKSYHDSAVNSYSQQKEQALNEHLQSKAEFIQLQNKHNNDIHNWREQFENGDGAAVERFLMVILANSHFPDAISAESEVFYDIMAKTAIVSFGLPSPDDLPNEVGYRYIASRKAIDPILMKPKELASFYENTIHKIALRTIHELFSGVYIAGILDAVVFNGWVNGIDKATGKDFRACILSVQAEKPEFEQIKLDKVDPRECLRALKAISAGPLYNLAPVKPIMDLNRDDKRFVASIDIADNLEMDSNLATMPWEDFEHLVRQLFGKVFSKDGCEVQVTQASRDGGVDAIAFDPDPIRGGKFVIQAKRYNNVVPVSACRDLYGTMINEGAVKGILVTTSYFGNDSRTFVKDKPITLIDGSNLIYMFNEFGYNFRINLKE